MSTNCTRCVRNNRTGPDLLCDLCRSPTPEQERGGIFIRDAIMRAGVSPSDVETRLAQAAGITDDELRDAILGRGSCGGRPEPRVLHGLCRELGASYKDAMIACGHLIPK